MPNTVSPTWTNVTNAGVSPDAWLTAHSSNLTNIRNILSDIQNQQNNNRDAMLKWSQQDYMNKINDINQERLTSLYNLQQDQLKDKINAQQWLVNNASKYMVGNKVNAQAMLADMQQQLPNNIFAWDQLANMVNLGILQNNNPTAFNNAVATTPTTDTTATNTLTNANANVNASAGNNAATSVVGPQSYSNYDSNINYFNN